MKIDQGEGFEVCYLDSSEAFSSLSYGMVMQKIRNPRLGTELDPDFLENKSLGVRSRN